MVITDILHQICTCCTNPIVYEEEEVFRRIPTTPATKTSAVNDPFFIANTQEGNAPADVSTTVEEGVTSGEGPTAEVNTTATEEDAATGKTAALKKDTTALDDAAAVSNGFFISSLQDDVDQSEIFPVPWKDDDKTGLDLKDMPEVGAVVAKPEDVDQPLVHPVSWSGASKGATVWGGVVPSALKSKADSEEQKNLPLPWESGGKLTPVPYDGTNTGPSWEHQ